MGMTRDNTDAPPKTYRRLSKGDPTKVILVRIAERDGKTYGAFSARALIPGRTLSDFGQEPHLSVPDALSQAQEWVRPDIPLRLLLIGNAKWSDEWGSLEGQGDHPSLKPLETSEVVQHGCEVIREHIGAVIVGVEQYKNAFGFTLKLEDGSLRALLVKAGPDADEPGWLSKSSFVLSEFKPPMLDDPSIRIIEMHPTEEF